MTAGPVRRGARNLRASSWKVPALTSLNLSVGRALRMKKDYAGAVEAYGEVLKAEPGSQKALLELARTHRRVVIHASAIAALEKVIAVNGSTEEARDARALLAQLKHSHERSARHSCSGHRCGRAAGWRAGARARIVRVCVRHRHLGRHAARGSSANLRYRKGPPRLSTTGRRRASCSTTPGPMPRRRCRHTPRS